jgi:hypothetical protein
MALRSKINKPLVKQILETANKRVASQRAPGRVPMVPTRTAIAAWPAAEGR